MGMRIYGSDYRVGWPFDKAQDRYPPNKTNERRMLALAGFVGLGI